MANLTVSYETIMIFNAKVGEDGVKALFERFKTLIEENGGTIGTVEEWGKRRFAYPIQDELEGYYYLVEFTGNPAIPAELDRVYKITDGVLRSLIIRKEDEKENPRKKKAVKPEAEKAV